MYKHSCAQQIMYQCNCFAFASIPLPSKIIRHWQISETVGTLYLGSTHFIVSLKSATKLSLRVSIVGKLRMLTLLNKKFNFSVQFFKRLQHEIFVADFFNKQPLLPYGHFFFCNISGSNSNFKMTPRRAGHWGVNQK